MRELGSQRTFASVMVLVLLGSLGAHEYYSVSPDDGFLREVSIFSYMTLSSRQMTVPGDVVLSGHGIAHDEDSGDLWAAVQLGSRPAGQHTLVSVNHTNAACAIVGDLGDKFTSLTADLNNQILWGLTDATATTPAALFSIDVTTGATTFALTLGARDGGQALEFNIDDGLLYHAAGTSTRLFEKIHPVTLARTAIPVGGSWGQPSMLYFDDANTSFLMTSPAILYQVNPDGQVFAFFQSIDHNSKGFGGVWCPENCGDCNRDGSMPNIIDSLTAAQMAVGIQEPNSGDFLCCDVNFSQTLDILDALLIAQAAAGLPVVLTCHS